MSTVNMTGIRGVDLDDASRELNESLKSYVPPKKPDKTTKPTQIPAASREDRAQRILGVPASASFDEIRRTFERLNKRGDPSRFPAGSIEQEHATAIQKSVQWAYGVLSANFDSTEKRFRSLEIE